MNRMKLVVGGFWHTLFLVVLFFGVSLTTHHLCCPHIACCKRSPVFFLFLRFFDTFFGVFVGVFLL